MAVGYGASSNTGSDQYVTSLGVPVPSGAATDQIALVALDLWESTNPTVTAPGGFTKFIEMVDGNLKTRIYWKRLTGADSGNYTFSWSGSQWAAGQAILVTGGLASGDPVTVFNTATATNTAIVSTSVTTGFQPFLAHFCNNESGATGTPPTNFTEVQDVNVLKTNYYIPGSSGSFTASGGTISVSTLHHAALVAVEPAGSAPVSGPIVGISQYNSFH